MKYFLLITSIIISICSKGQDNSINKSIETEIQSKNEFDISIIKVFPQDFPNVSIVFQAKNQAGEPLWLLTKDDFKVKENTLKCEVLDVRNISENKPLNIALVFHHSGSMIENPEQMTDTSISYQDLYHNQMLPDNYVMSIEYAQEAVLNFFQSDTQPKDSMFFVGFSGVVDNIAPLSNNFNSFKNIVENSKPGGYTAFYDAVYNAIDSLKNHPSKPAVIALTDGGDNSSKHTSDDVIEFAKDNNVPIYIIGLGNVNSNKLNRICNETNGFYYHTKKASKLSEIYENIKRQLRSIYELDYTSNEDHSADPIRRLKFYFTNDTLSFNYNEYKFELPEEVVEHLENRQEELKKIQLELEQQEQFEKNVLITGSIAGILMLGIGGFIILKRKNKKSGPKIIKVYPNPFSNQITVIFETQNNGKLRILNTTGIIMQEIQISSDMNEFNFDLPELTSGTYLVSIQTELSNSNVVKTIKK